MPGDWDLSPAQDDSWDLSPGGAKSSGWGDYLGMATRGIGGFLGAEGGIPGAAIGGGTDLLAQLFEKVGGSRKDFSLKEAGVNAAASAIPFGRIMKGLAPGAKLAARYAIGGAHSAANAGALDVVNQYDERQAAGANADPYDWGRTLRSGEAGYLVGLAGGMGGHALENAVPAVSQAVRAKRWSNPDGPLAKPLGLNTGTKLSREEAAALRARVGTNREERLANLRAYDVEAGQGLGELGRVPAGSPYDVELPPLTTDRLDWMRQLDEEAAQHGGRGPSAPRSSGPPAADVPWTSEGVRTAGANHDDWVILNNQAEAAGAVGQPRTAGPAGPPEPPLEVPRETRRSMEWQARERERIDRIPHGTPKAEANPIPPRWSNGEPATPGAQVPPLGPGDLPNGLPDLEQALGLPPGSLSGDAPVLEPSRMRGGYNNEGRRSGFRDYTPEDDGQGDTLLDLLSPDDGIQHNGSGGTSASTEASNRAAQLRDAGVVQATYDSTGARTVHTDPAQIADPRAHPGQTVVREYPDGRVEILDDNGGKLPQRAVNDAPRPAMGQGADSTGTYDISQPAPGEDPLAGIFDEFSPQDAVTGIAKADQRAGFSTPFEDPTAPKAFGPQKQFVPAEHVSSWQEIQDRINAKPGATPPEKNVTEYSARLTNEPNERKLWNLERKANRAARARVGDRMLPPVDPTPTLTPNLPDGTVGPFPGDVGGESGQIDPDLLKTLGIHLGSGVANTAIAGALSDKETRTRNMIAAGLLGTIAPLAVTNPKALMRARYFSLLARASPQIKNVLGGASNTAIRSLEEGLRGNWAGAKDLASSVFSTDTLHGFRNAWDEAGQSMPASSRWGDAGAGNSTWDKVTQAPSRLMHAADEAVTGGLERGGLSNDEARTVLMTSAPKSATGQGLVSLTQKSPLLSLVAPFMRTATNTLERGLEHVPLIGELPNVKSMRNSDWQRRLIRQSLGGAALAGGAVLGNQVPAWAQPYVAAASGPLAVPYLLGTAGMAAYNHRGDPYSNIIRSAGETIRDQTPLPTDSYDWDLGRLLASWIPGAVADASTIKPSEFNTSRSIFDPAIARIPGLNSAVLPRAAKRAKKRQ